MARRKAAGGNSNETNGNRGALTAVRDTLLPRLLSGEIRVKEAEKVMEACR